MSLVKFLPHALIIGVLAAILQFVGLVPKAAAYLVVPAIFQTWALYFFAGAKPLPGVKAVVCGVLGVLASMLIVVMGGKMVPLIGAQMAFTVAVFVVASLVILMELVPPLNCIPAYFIGSGIFFLLPQEMAMKTKLTLISIALGMGFVLGYLTVLFRGMYAAKLAAAESAKPKAEPELVASR